MYRESELERQNAIREYAHFLQSQKITHIVTLLLRDPASEDAVNRLIQKLYEGLPNDQDNHQGLRLFWIAQVPRYGGQSTWITCLFIKTSDAQILSVSRWFDSKYGWSKIEKKAGPISGYRFMKTLFSNYAIHGFL